MDMNAPVHITTALAQPSMTGAAVYAAWFVFPVVGDVVGAVHCNLKSKKEEEEEEKEKEKEEKEEKEEEIEPGAGSTIILFVFPAHDDVVGALYAEK